MFSAITGFILRPFVAPIRYGALKIMKRMRSPDDMRPVIAAADHLLDEFLLPSVFRVFREAEFRKLAQFKKLSVSEYDRIFNELEVSGVCMALAYLASAKPLAKAGDFHFWRNVEERLIKQFQRKLMGLGVDSANAKLMRELIEMRYQEYEKLSEEVWDVGVAANMEFRKLPSDMKRIGASVQAIAIGTVGHIRRGKIAEKDTLVQFLIAWLLSLQRSIGVFVRRL